MQLSFVISVRNADLTMGHGGILKAAHFETLSGPKEAYEIRREYNIH